MTRTELENQLYSIGFKTQGDNYYLKNDKLTISCGCIYENQYSLMIKMKMDEYPELYFEIKFNPFEISDIRKIINEYQDRMIWFFKSRIELLQNSIKELDSKNIHAYNT